MTDAMRYKNRLRDYIKLLRAKVRELEKEKIGVGYKRGLIRAAEIAMKEYRNPPDESYETACLTIAEAIRAETTRASS